MENAHSKTALQTRCFENRPSVSERPFSAIRCIKTYLRSTMSQEYLNHIMILHIHKELTDTLDLNYVGNEFHTKSDHRKAKFPTF